MGTNQGILNPSDIAVLRSLHDRGFAVCVFTPEEIGNAEQEEVEDHMCHGGWATINFNNLGRISG
jgi:hypothetical protein